MKVIPIGIIHSRFKQAENAPIQPSRSQAVGKVEVFEKYRKGLSDIDGFSHLILVYRFHKARGYLLKVSPFLDPVARGVFATRHPRRPNRLGFSMVKLLRRRGRVLWVRGIDTLDGTPLLDIKPYVPDFDRQEKSEIGWLKHRIRKNRNEKWRKRLPPAARFFSKKRFLE